MNFLSRHPIKMPRSLHHRRWTPFSYMVRADNHIEFVDSCECRVDSSARLDAMFACSVPYSYCGVEEKPSQPPFSMEKEPEYRYLSQLDCGPVHLLILL
jgi:hypothetical protein